MNLGVHLVRDAFRGEFDVAAVLTNDTDLCEPIRIVRQELNLPVILLAPSSKPSASLSQLVTSTRTSRATLVRANFLIPCRLQTAVWSPNQRAGSKPNLSSA